MFRDHVGKYYPKSMEHNSSRCLDITAAPRCLQRATHETSLSGWKLRGLRLNWVIEENLQVQEWPTSDLDYSNWIARTFVGKQSALKVVVPVLEPLKGRPRYIVL